MPESAKRIVPFNSAVEIGLRTLVLLNESYPRSCSLGRLVIYDYLVVHSDDVDDGPDGLHPQTPHRAGELVVRRNMIQKGIALYESRQLIEREYSKDGINYLASDSATEFLDSIAASYANELRERAAWVHGRFGELNDDDLNGIASENMGRWGAEFESEAVLWEEEWYE